VVDFGPSGLGRECLDVVAAMTDAGAATELVGVDYVRSAGLVDRPAMRGLAHLGSMGVLVAGADASVGTALGVGHHLGRTTLIERLDAAGFSASAPVHPGSVTSVVTRDVPSSVAVSGAPRPW
jgi:hypothetical protein